MTTASSDSSAAHRLTVGASARNSSVTHSDEENENSHENSQPAAARRSTVLNTNPSAPPLHEAASVPKPALAAAPNHRRSMILPTPPAPKPAVPKAKALYDFNAQEANELPFKFGDVIMVHKMEGDWWEGELAGRRGLLPSNYVQLL